MVGDVAGRFSRVDKQGPPVRAQYRPLNLASANPVCPDVVGVILRRYGDSRGSPNDRRDDAALSDQVQLHAADVGQADRGPRRPREGRSGVHRIGRREAPRLLVRLRRTPRLQPVGGPGQRVHGRGGAGDYRWRCAQLVRDDSSLDRRRNDGCPAQGRTDRVPSAGGVNRAASRRRCGLHTASSAHRSLRWCHVADAPSQLIDARIAELDDWRGETLARIRALIKQADPEVVEEWKWRGTPVWSHDGMICTGETYKNVVKMTFAKGASLEDPAGLFNSSLEGNTRRAIDFREGDEIDEAAFKALVRDAVALNTAA